MKKLLLILFNCLSFLCMGQAMPFDYDLHLFTIPGSSPRTMVCCHGYGANYQIAETLKSLGVIDATLVSFNFPDHDLQQRDILPEKATFGMIDELLPALYVLKTMVVDHKHNAIDLYGFSAGGGAIINLIAVLNTTNYGVELQKIGIGQQEKAALLKAIQNGLIILDAPLKSVEEIIDLRGSSEELEILAKNYRENHFRPIDTLERLQGLDLNMIVHFQNPDEIIFNRDDQIYIERLKRANRSGTTSVIVGNDGGHLAPHWSLWRFYSQNVSYSED